MKKLLSIVLGMQAVSVTVLFASPNNGRLYSMIMGLLCIGGLLFWLLTENKNEIEEVVQERLRCETGELKRLVSHFELQAMTDALTGLLNRRGGEESIKHHIARSARVQTSISFVLVDIDHFKNINDTHGHGVGDTVISGISQALKANLRAADFAIRWGGEEFLICLPDTDLAGAATIAEKLRSIIEQIDFGIRKVTASFGCAELGQDPFNVALARADMHLYFAKSKGRNQVFPNFFHKKLDES